MSFTMLEKLFVLLSLSSFFTRLHWNQFNLSCILHYRFVICFTSSIPIATTLSTVFEKKKGDAEDSLSIRKHHSGLVHK